MLMLDWPLTQDLSEIHRWANMHFVWVPDQDVWKKPDFWATEAELEQNALEHDGIVNDDCDGRASMIVIACRKMRVPARFMVVATEFCPSWCFYDHCIAESGGMLSDNRFPQGLETRGGLEARGYRFIEMSGLHAADDWTRVI